MHVVLFAGRSSGAVGGLSRLRTPELVPEPKTTSVGAGHPWWGGGEGN
jgi:hypothetical protein